MQSSSKDMALDTVSPVGDFDLNSGIQSAIADTWARPSSSRSDARFEQQISDPVKNSFADDPARKKIFDDAVNALKNGSFTDRKAIEKAIINEYTLGGDEALKNLVNAVNEKLPQGKKFDIKEDPDLLKSLQDDFAKNSNPLPNFARWVEFTQDGRAVVQGYIFAKLAGK